ncbi:methyl-accepting chemotaxis protein [Anaeromyxobacter diazotrophicus]|uniref:Methyl-accepting chemotaxis sensory transducer n=1 Tax=Anaeromyxobacter diazotrophicus TaxID=2590199 RepID=A0A7I9VUA5_9BACT|nr:methyl-accepting chemotaxis protein [Anaeromyxobacter diazotrophicus]GEJ59547.1 hypothetical protein AMYX_42880 [Anaeromyxobacter diazotrophicus]
MTGLGFKQKVLLLPAVATATLLVMGATDLALGARAITLLQELETERVPIVTSSRDLQEQLERLQRALQDAVAAEDLEAIAETAKLRDAFLARAAEAASGDDRSPPRAVSAEFRAYYAHARAAAEQLVARRTAPQVLEETVARYRALRDELAARTAADRRRLAEGFQEVRRLQRLRAFVMGGLTLAAVAFLAWLAAWVGRSVARPVLELARAAQRVAAGDLSHGLGVHPQDELGELARSFEVMVEKLRVVPASLLGSVEELSAAVGAVASASGTQGALLEKQQAGLARSRTTAERIHRESEETSRRAEAVLKMAGQVEAFGDAAQLAARDTLTGLSDIGEEVRAMTDGIGRLTAHTQLVRELVLAMKRLGAEATELALSVSVEAARAGASEGPLSGSARQLHEVAARLVQASGRVTKALGEVDAVVASVGALSDGHKRRMEKGLEQIRTSGESLREITAVVQKSGRAARAIVASVTEQGQAIAEITKDVVEIDRAMGEALRSKRSAERAAESLKRATNSIAGVVQSFRV